MEKITQMLQDSHFRMESSSYKSFEIDLGIYVEKNRVGIAVFIYYPEKNSGLLGTAMLPEYQSHKLEEEIQKVIALFAFEKLKAKSFVHEFFFYPTENEVN